MKKVLVIVAHPDDELMCAGTVARLVSQDTIVRVVALFYSDLDRKGEILGVEKQRWSEFSDSIGALGCRGESWNIYNEDDFKWGQEYVKRIDGLLNWEPDLIITHRIKDTNQSHSKLAQVVRSSCRKNNVTIWEMNHAIPGGWEPDAKIPNLLVNITNYIDIKRQAFQCYKSQLERYPDMLEASEARDRYLGWMLATENPEIKYAEGFTVHKQCWV